MMPPIALVVSAIAFARNQSRGEALAGIILSALTLLVVFGFPLLAALCN